MKKVQPGDTLEIYATLKSFRRGVAIGNVQSYVGNEAAVSFDVTAVVIDEFEKFRVRS